MVLKNRAERTDRKQWEPQGAGLGPGLGALRAAVQAAAAQRRLRLGGAVVKNLPADAGDTGDAGLVPGSGRFPGGGNGNPLQHSCLENPMD